jgi:hypothetical protein
VQGKGIFAVLALILAGRTGLGQIAILQIQVLEGEGTVHAPGSHNPRPLTVGITDETGRPLSGVAVSFHFPDDGAGATLPNGLRTGVVTTDARGIASLRSFQVNRIPGRFAIRVIASKEQARAGALSFQYIAEPKSAAAKSAASHGKAKWLVLAAIAAGGGAAAVVAKGHGGTSQPPPEVTIGGPSISVGKP